MFGTTKAVEICRPLLKTRYGPCMELSPERITTTNELSGQKLRNVLQFNFFVNSHTKSFESKRFYGTRYIAYNITWL